MSTGLEASFATRRGSFALAVDDLSAAPGETMAVVGPNGAGKTTLLRVVAGLVPAAAGRVRLGGEVLDEPSAGVFVPPERRSIGVAFQDHALFPHLTVLDNVAFGLRCRGGRRREVRREAAVWLERVGLGERLRARPAQLSGGESQRVALARALASRPRALLLDEPLAALDASTRVTIRRELRRHLADFEGVRLLVTHDVVDALALADRVVVVEDGRIAQIGRPEEIRATPRSRYAADLVGVNLLRGRARGDRVDLDAGGRLIVPDAGHGEVYVVVHPHTVALHRRRPEGTPRNVWRASIEALDPEGDRARVRVAGAVPLVAEVTAGAVDDLRLARGGPVWVTLKATEIRTYPA